MKLINADKYKKDIEHYRNTICYQRNVTMDDCMRILDKQEDVLDKIRNELINRYPKNYAGELELGGNACHFSLNEILKIINKYTAESEE